jgi:hypothetical protein
MATKSRHVQWIFVWQAIILLIFLFMTFSNEVLDLPHLLLGDSPTSWPQRTGEICIEVIISLSVVSLETYFFRKLLRRIKILEGFLPICANCKKIRKQDQWVQIEQYIGENSLARFSHSLCPECVQKLYPDLFDKQDSGKK